MFLFSVSIARKWPQAWVWYKFLQKHIKKNNNIKSHLKMNYAAAMKKKTRKKLEKTKSIFFEISKGNETSFRGNFSVNL